MRRHGQSRLVVLPHHQDFTCALDQGKNTDVNLKISINGFLMGDCSCLRSRIEDPRGNADRTIPVRLGRQWTVMEARGVRHAVPAPMRSAACKVMAGPAVGGFRQGRRLELNPSVGSLGVCSNSGVPPGSS